MPEAIHFALSLLTMLLIATAILRHSRVLMNFAFSAMMLSSLYGWYLYIFPEGVKWLFFAGTLVTVATICYFFYAVYTVEPIRKKTVKSG